MRMSPERFRECLKQIGWSNRGVAEMLGTYDMRIRRWADGLYPVPDPVARWLETLARVHERNPAPKLEE